jgi:hypothetical protein
MKLDPFNLIESLCREIALATMGTTNDRDILNDQQAVPFAVTPRYMTKLCSFFSTNITYHRYSPGRELMG